MEKTYIFSKAFYDKNIAEMDEFEVQVYKYISGEMLDIPMLLKFYHEYSSWSTEEQYYRIPILSLMLDNYVKSIGYEV